MKHRYLRMGIVLVLMALVTGLASAQTNLPGSGWYSTSAIQNINLAESATVNIEVFPQQGSTVSGTTTNSFTLPAGTFKQFVAGGSNQAGTVDVSITDTNFTGAMVVSSSEPVVAVGETTNYRHPSFTAPAVGVTGGYASGYYRGSSVGAATLVYPVVKNNFVSKTTLFSIQAAGSNATGVNATIRGNNGAVYNLAIGTIEANKSKLLLPDQFGMTDLNCLAGGATANTTPCMGSLTVTATSGELVGAVVEFKEGTGAATIAQAASLFPSTEASDTLYCPAIKHTYTTAQKRTTGMVIANTSAATVTVDVVFTVDVGPSGVPAGTTYTRSTPIGPNKAVTFSSFDNNLGTSPNLMKAGTLASAKITVQGGADSIIGVVNESNFGTTPVKSTIYTCFSPTQATNKVAAPIVMKNYQGAGGGPSVQNINTAGDIKVYATYYCTTNGTTFTTYNPTTTPTLTSLISPNLAPGKSYTFFNPAAIPNGSRCSAVLEAKNTDGTTNASNKLVSIVSETNDFAPTTPATLRLLDTRNYEGFAIQ